MPEQYEGPPQGGWQPPPDPYGQPPVYDYGQQQWAAPPGQSWGAPPDQQWGATADQQVGAAPDQQWGYEPFGPPNLPGMPPTPGPGRRKAWVSPVIAVAVILVVVAMINAFRGSNNNVADPRPSLSLANPDTSPSFPFPLPEPSGSSPGRDAPFGSDPGGTAIPAVFCPYIRDEKSHLAYECIDDSLIQDDADNFLGIRISLNRLVEPNWVVSEGSGNPDSITSSPTDQGVISYNGAARRAPATPTPSHPDVINEVERRANRAFEQAYGENPSPKLMSHGDRKIDGVTGYQVLYEITMNPQYRKDRNPPLRTKVERLWVVGVPTNAGVSIFMLSIPDLRKDLWPKADATISTIKII